MSECHLFGNGPSHKAAPSTPVEHSYGCNIRIKDRPVRAIGCIDNGYVIKRLIDQVQENEDGTCIYMTSAVARHLTRKVLDKPWVQKVLEYGWSTESRMNYQFNCGQVMAHFLHKRYDVINLWGFDSLSTGDISSWHHDLPDAHLCVMPPNKHPAGLKNVVTREEKNEHWMISWQKLVSDLGQKTTFVNNMPSPNGSINSEVLNDLFTNLRT
jgi:hypothetical protein